jgi:hypothetical protein
LSNISLTKNALSALREDLAEYQTSDRLISSASSIATELATHGISFEGNELAVSLNPTLVTSAETERAATAGAVLRRVLNRSINQFITEHVTGQLDGPMHRFFTPYFTWWNLIASERRTHDAIQLMRYDAVRADSGGWSFIETNTACPGGTIHCSRVRTAWLNSDVAGAVENQSISEFAVDDPTGFVTFMARRAEEIDPTAPNIAILNYQGDYTNELESLRRCHAALRASGQLSAGELLLGDITELRVVGEEIHLRGVKLSLIHNKLDQLQINPEDAAVANWVAAARSTSVEFLNSLGSLYLTEAKRSLVLLSDPNWNRHLRLTDDEAAVISEYVPYTRLLQDLVQDGDGSSSLPGRARQSFVLKADSLTRGSGIFIGGRSTVGEWARAIETTRQHHGVAQLMCDLPSRPSKHVTADRQIIDVVEYFGVDVFFFGEDFAGMVGRSHTEQIFNVGNGGRETPVLVIGGDCA